MKQPTSREIGLRIEQERKSLGATQDGLAKKLGIGRTSLIRYESGARYPTGRFLAGAAAAGLDVSYILTGRYQATNPKQSHSQHIDPDVLTIRINCWQHAVLNAGGTISDERIKEKNGSDHQQMVDLLNRIDIKYPGTKYWWDSDIWRLISNFPITADDIRLIFEAMPSLIRSIFVGATHERQALFWRRPVDIGHACVILNRMLPEDINAFTMIIALAREAEMNQDVRSHSIVAGNVQISLQILQNHPTLGSFIPFIENKIKHWWIDPGYLDEYLLEEVDEDDEIDS